jgi:hypothetical protein
VPDIVSKERSDGGLVSVLGLREWVSTGLRGRLDYFAFRWLA